MKCPLRCKTVYNYNKAMVDGKLVLDSTVDEWPDCYEDDCPFYNRWATYSCDKLTDAEE